MTTAETAIPQSAATGRLLVLIAALLWSLSGVVAKGLAPLSGAEIAFYRSLFAGLALLPFVNRSRWIFRPAMIPLTLIFGAMVGLYLSSLARTTAANAILLQYSATFWTVPLGLIFLGEKPARQDRLPIALATLGILAIVVFGHDGSRKEGVGVLYGLASGLGYATIVVGMRAFRDLDPTWLSAVNNLGGALALGAMTWVLVGPIHTPSLRQTIVLIAFGVIQMAIPYALFARGLRSIGSAEATLITLLEPLLMPVWVYLAHHERPALPTLIGGGFLLAGVAVRYLPGFSPKRVEHEPGE